MNIIIHFEKKDVPTRKELVALLRQAAETAKTAPIEPQRYLGAPTVIRDASDKKLGEMGFMED